MVKTAWEQILDPSHAFIIAEAGVNHNGSLKIAKELVDAAVAAEADAVKFQTFKAELLVTSYAPKAEYQLQATNKNESQFDMLKRLELSEKDFSELMEYSENNGITFLSTPFDKESADFLDNIGVTAFKIGSGDIANIPLLSHVASKGKPMLVSTGMSSLGEVENAVNIIEATGNARLALLHCVSNYPADAKDVNLSAMSTMQKAFNLPVGYSDHTPGAAVAIAAVALGARILEKHFTLSRNMEGPDHQASLEPHEFKTLVDSIRQVEVSLGDGRKKAAPSEQNTLSVARRSLVAACNIAAGTKLTQDLISIKRPGTGLPPIAVPYVLGRTLHKDVKTGTLLSLEMFE
ncbi:MAG: N-acetylneuraminate synthase [Pseudomonadota bacterium]